MLFLWLGYNERQQHYTCLRCEVQFDAILHLCAFVGLLPLFFQTCFCMEKKRTALNADQSQVTKSAKNFRGWQSQVTKSAKRFGGPLQGIVHASRSADQCISTGPVAGSEILLTRNHIQTER